LSPSPYTLDPGAGGLIHTTSAKAVDRLPSVKATAAPGTSVTTVHSANPATAPARCTGEDVEFRVHGLGFRV